MAGLKPIPLSGFILTSQRPRYLEIRAVMEQIPEIQKDSLDQFDCKLLNPSLQKVADKRRKDQFKRLIAGCIGVGHAASWCSQPPCSLRPCVQADQKPATALGHYGEMIFQTTHSQGPALVLLICFPQKPLGEQFRKEVHIKNLPSLFKKTKPVLETEVLDNEEGGLATIFEP